MSKCLAWATGFRFVPCPEIETAGGRENVRTDRSLLLDFKVLVYGNLRVEPTDVNMADYVVSKKQQIQDVQKAVSNN